MVNSVFSAKTSKKISSIFAAQKLKSMKIKYLLSAAFTLCAANLFAQTKTDSVKVWGNCDECKAKIESAATKAGATNANWSDETYMLVVNYDESKTNVMDIEKSVAAVGYDTQDVKATEAAYKKLPKCCQYKRDVDPEVKED